MHDETHPFRQKLAQRFHYIRQFRLIALWLGREKAYEILDDMFERLDRQEAEARARETGAQG